MFGSKIVFTKKGKRYYLDGKEVSEAEYSAAFPDLPLDFSKGAFGSQTTWSDPVVSDGAACHPKRIKEFEDFAAKHGVPTDFSTHRGRPILENRAHRKKLLKVLRLHDNDGGIGD